MSISRYIITRKCRSFPNVQLEIVLFIAHLDLYCCYYISLMKEDICWEGRERYADVQYGKISLVVRIESR